MADDTTRLDTDVTTDDNIQHGIDDNPVGDAGKGAVLGGIGGAAVGAAAGAMAGPAGMAIGAIVGGLAGAAGSGAAVAAVDSVDNDNNVSGVGDGVSSDVDDEADDLNVDTTDNFTGAQGYDRTAADLPAVGGYAGSTGTSGYAGSTVSTGDLLDDDTDTLAATDRTVDAYNNAGTRLDSDLADDGIQHGIDDDPNHDPAKGAVIGGVGGAAIGATAGAIGMAGGAGAGAAGGAAMGVPGGPAGMAAGAAIGAALGAVGAGVATAAVDSVDNDNKLSGVGSGVTPDTDADDSFDSGLSNRADDDLLPGNNVPGIQTGGRDADGSPDTRGIMEKASDAVTGDRIDDKTGKRVD